MANAVYNRFRQGILAADYDLVVASIKCTLVRGYTYSAAHATMADVVAAGGTLNGTSAALTNPTITNGLFDADNTSIATTASASNHVLIVFQASAVTGGADVPQNQQLLIAYYDTGTDIPIQPGTGTVAVTWPAASPNILRVN